MPPSNCCLREKNGRLSSRRDATIARVAVAYLAQAVVAPTVRRTRGGHTTRVRTTRRQRVEGQVPQDSLRRGLSGERQGSSISELALAFPSPAQCGMSRGQRAGVNAVV